MTAITPNHGARPEQVFLHAHRERRCAWLCVDGYGNSGRCVLQQEIPQVGLAHLGEEQIVSLLDKEVRGATAPRRSSTIGTAIIFDLHGIRATGDQMVARAVSESKGDDF